MKPCADPSICGVQNHRPGTTCRAENRGASTGKSFSGIPSTPASASMSADTRAAEPCNYSSGRREVRFYDGDNGDNVDRMVELTQSHFDRDEGFSVKVETVSRWAGGVPVVRRTPEGGYAVSTNVGRAPMSGQSFDTLEEAYEHAAERYGHSDGDRDEYDMNEEDDWGSERSRHGKHEAL